MKNRWQTNDVNAPSAASSIHILYIVISGLLLSEVGTVPHPGLWPVTCFGQQNAEEGRGCWSKPGPQAVFSFCSLWSLCYTSETTQAIVLDDGERPRG